ncbi:MAG: FG-GAP-like repeat-containing protein, partial [Pseudomonadota bacterium]
MSWGSAWGDFNADGWPDLWTSNHHKPPSLYQNMRDGTFQDVVLQLISPDVWALVKRYDTHGAAWADFDNDGDQDLVQLVDGGTPTEPNQLYVNIDGQRFEELASGMNVDLSLRRGRTPLWLDWNNDGWLDLLATHLPRAGEQGPAALYEQKGAEFEDVTNTVGLDVQFSNFALLSELDLTGGMELMLGSPASSLVLDLEVTPFPELNQVLGLDSMDTIVDALAADLNGDLDTDLYIVRGPKKSDIVQTDARTVEASIVKRGQEIGFRFRAPGTVSFDIYPKWKFSTADVFIGASGAHPGGNPFSLSIDDPNLDEIASHNAGVDKGIFISYDATTQFWQLLYSTPKWDTLNIVVQADVPIMDLAAVGFDPDAVAPPGDILFLRNSGVFEERTLMAGIDKPSSGHSVVAGDFDNDMDLDLYIVATGPVQNAPNILYENSGDGTFAEVSGAGGAAGTLTGRGGTVSVSDYDRDGFLDIFVTNGKAPEPFDENGPYQLFRNAGNGNHWIEIDLEGLISNRDGIGARVLATAGGTTQLREQTGGMHFRTQNHQRIHFGLGKNTAVDIEVQWPGGVTQELHNVQADQVLRVIEAAPAPAAHIADITAPGFVTRGEEFTILAEVLNGPGAGALASGVTFTGILPAGLVYQSATFSVDGANGDCAHAGGVVTCDIGSLNIDQVAHVDIVVTADLAAGLSADLHTVTASVTSSSSVDSSILETNQSGVSITVTAVTGLPVILDPAVTLSVFDTGGALNPDNNGGLTLGGLEVDPSGEGVFVVAGDANIYSDTTSLQLIHSRGPGTATATGAPEPIRLVSWAYDLTHGPEGRYYVAGAISGVGGIYGFDPTGVTSVNTFASGTPAWATSGLTFDTTGSTALVSTDSENGLYQVTADASVTKLISQGGLPDGIPRGADDHIVTLDGRTILAGDKSHDLWDVTNGAGFIRLLVDLDALFVPGGVPGWTSDDNVWGSRATVDPVSGDIFYSHAAAAPPDIPVSIIRVAADGSAASIFATGFSVLRDMDFGPSSSGSGRSLYVSEISDGTGSIYEITFGESGAMGTSDTQSEDVSSSTAAGGDSGGGGGGGGCTLRPDSHFDPMLLLLVLTSLLYFGARRPKV